MLLILREEIICFIILASLVFYYFTNKVKDKEMLFPKIACVGLLHLAFDMATVAAVNNMGATPRMLNDALHVGFYLSGILFIQQFYNYVVHTCALHKHFRRLERAGYFPLLLFLALLLFLPMEYVEGSGTNYSYGPLAFIGYGIFTAYCSVCVAMLLICRKKLDKRVRRSLLPMIAAMFAAVLAQALVPELLMTGGGITFICIGMFVALDNPDKDYREQALWDFITGLRNRNCYNRDMEKYAIRHRNGRQRIGFVVADMNFLKAVNDKYGHAEGDRLIAAAAGALRDNLLTAQGIYRLGGDEFAAVYLSPDDGKVAAEMANVRAACLNEKSFAVPLSLAMGYAAGSIGEDIGAVFAEADRLMYEDKAGMKEKHPSLAVR